MNIFFQMRVKFILETYFRKHRIKINQTWFRIEYQTRCTAYEYRCFRLDCDLGIAQLELKVLRGYCGQESIKKYNKIDTDFYLSKEDIVKEQKVNEANVVINIITLFHSYF